MQAKLKVWFEESAHREADLLEIALRTTVALSSFEYNDDGYVKPMTQNLTLRQRDF